MKKLLLPIFALGAVSASAQHLYGDLDHDGHITVADEIMLRNIILGNANAEEITPDIFIPKTYTINGIEYPMPEAVDLGLPSGTLWANMNIGASYPEDCGGAYCWGDPTGEYTCDDYPFIPYEEDWDNPIDYGDGGIYASEKEWDSDLFGGVNPPRFICGTELDIATQKLGEGWQLPLLEDFEELYRYTTVEYHRGVIIFKGDNGNSITIILEGDCYEYRKEGVERIGALYWTGESLGEMWPGRRNWWAQNVDFYEDDLITLIETTRNTQLLIRAIKK